MSDERIIEVIAESLSPVLFHDAIPTVKRRLRMRASGILFDLREAGFDVYRPDECERVVIGEIRQVHFDGRLADVPVVEIELEPGPWSLVAGAYRLVPVEGDS